MSYYTGDPPRGPEEAAWQARTISPAGSSRRIQGRSKDSCVIEGVVLHAAGGGERRGRGELVFTHHLVKYAPLTG